MEGPRVVLLILLLLFVFFTPDQPIKRRQRLDDDQIDAERQNEFDILINSTYGELNRYQGFNLTGFRQEDGYQWNLLSTAQNIARKQYKDAWSEEITDLPVYADVTGEVRGKFIRSKSSSNLNLPINLTTLVPQNEYLITTFQRNVTEDEGEIGLTLYDSSESKDAREIKAELTIWSESAPGNGWQAIIQGVHFINGGIILSTTSNKFNSIPIIPQFTLDQKEFNISKQVLNQTLVSQWEKNYEEIPEGLLGAPSCEIVAWLQPKYQLPHLTTQQLKTYLNQVEEELASPEGAPIGKPPPLMYSATVFSPDCGYILEADAIYGPKIEAFWRLADRLLLAFCIILGLQIALLKRQMEKAATPSTRSRISYQSIVIAALGDGLMLFVLIALLMIDEAALLMVSATAFLACIHVAFLEVKFVFDIWTVQVGDPARAEYERRRRLNPTQPQTLTTTPQPPASADGTIGLPVPATTPRDNGATPVIIPSDQDIGIPLQPLSNRATFATIYSRFYFSLVSLMFFSLWAISWPRGLRSAYANILVILYFSFWIPQIYRNTMRNCRKALSWEFVLGSTILRTVPVLYWYFMPRNILAVDTSPQTAFVLLAWVWLQVVILVSQQFLGPRLLVKESWCPPAYDYHPVLRDDDVETGGMPIGQLASASEAKDQDDKTRKVFDCAICMNEIDVPVVGKQDTGRTWLEQKDYMVTPCRHIFHAECLEGWMNLRLVCPVCREELPPL